MGNGRNFCQKYEGIRNGRCYFSGTSNKPSKNIAEVSINITNEDKKGPNQYKDLKDIEIKEKLKKIKVQNFINGKEVEQKMPKCFLQIYQQVHIHLP